MAAAVGSTVLTLNPMAADAVEGTDLISTIAGTGSAGVPGVDGAVSTTFAINSPEDVATDSSGAIYYSDRLNHRVFKIVDGKSYHVAGTGVAGLGVDGSTDAKLVQLNEPRGISIDSNDNLYIADSHNNRVRMVDLSTGLMTTVAGTGAAGTCVPGSGLVAGDGAAATSATLNCPKDMVVNDAGVMFIADSNNDRIRMVVGGTITTLAGDGTGDGLVVGGFLGEGTSANAAKLSNPTILVLDNSGVLYIADNGNNRIRQIVVSGTDGTISTIAGNGNAAFSGDGGPASSSELEGPEGLAIAADGVIYLSDTNNHRIRKIGTDGVISTIAGDGTAASSGDSGAASAAQLYSPEGMLLDADNNLVFAAVGENSIRQITLYVAPVVPPVTPPVSPPDHRLASDDYANDSGTHGEVTRLYIAVYKRMPDAEGHTFWVSQIDSGAKTYHEVATFFSVAPEFQLRYGDTTIEDFVDLLYENVLFRDSAEDQDGYNFWVNELTSGNRTRIDVLKHLAQSDEFKIATGTL